MSFYITLKSLKLLRSKGYFGWHLDQSSPGNGARRWRGSVWFAGMFWKSVPEENWPTDPDYLVNKEKLDEPFGDMRQELLLVKI